VILEGVRMAAEWLADATDGVNALLATVPRDGGDDVPPSVTIRDEYGYGACARREVPDPLLAGPELWVFTNNLAQLAGEPTTVFAEGRPELVVAYVTQDVDTSEALEDASYTLRAVLWSLRRFATQASSARLRNNVSWNGLVQEQTRWLPPAVPLAAGRVTQGLIVVPHLRDETGRG
jgi:hypothetical protein